MPDPGPLREIERELESARRYAQTGQKKRTQTAWFHVAFPVALAAFTAFLSTGLATVFAVGPMAFLVAVHARAIRRHYEFFRTPAPFPSVAEWAVGLGTGLGVIGMVVASYSLSRPEILFGFPGFAMFILASAFFHIQTIRDGKRSTAFVATVAGTASILLAAMFGSPANGFFALVFAIALFGYGLLAGAARK